MQKLVKKATDKIDTPWGLDWFVQAGHGGNGFRNCTLVEDASLSTPAYPYNPAFPPASLLPSGQSAANTPWDLSGVTVKGDLSTTTVAGQTFKNMWRWQSVQEIQYPAHRVLQRL